jgi:hypothetical protein
MEKEKIAQIARVITRAWQKTVITKKDKTQYVGFFNNNGDQKMIDKNMWNFFVFTKGETVLNGDDFLEIRIL